MSPVDASVFRTCLSQLVIPFWCSRRQWPALAMLATVLGIYFTLTYLAVLSNRFDGAVMDALVIRSWARLWPTLALLMAVGLTVLMLTALKIALLDLLKLRWRTWMTRRYLDAWTAESVYYALEREGRVDNADQRIAQDVASFVEKSLDIVTSAVFTLTSTVTFTLLLWKLGGALSFSVLGHPITIPGFQVWLAVVYSAGAIMVTHLFGRRLTGLFERRQGVEADFRHLGMRLRENAEQIAFHRGGGRERQRLHAGFERVRATTVDIIARSCKMTLARSVYVQVCSPLPTLASLPRYLSGAISLGDLTRTVGAFGALRSALSWWYQVYPDACEWAALGQRLHALERSLNAPPDVLDTIRVRRDTVRRIATGELHLRTPSGVSIARLAPLHVAAGERWLLVGPSGCGKSTLLRALAGVWPHGEGEIQLPTQALLMFLPQRSYLPSGTLRAALCYPAEVESYAVAECERVLAACGLQHYVAALASSEDWSRRLSGGEQQRLAIARALLHRPDFLFLDEATSALDPAAEQALYTALRHWLPQTALISVAHRDQVRAFHSHVHVIDAAVAASAGV